MFCFGICFLAQKLNTEYAELSERLVQKLGRKKTSPLATGQANIWAAAVIHAVGTINFLFDKSSEPYSTVDEINDFFGTSKSTTANKSKQIRDLLKLQVFDKEFSLNQVQKSNPFANMVMVNGFFVPLSELP